MRLCACGPQVVDISAEQHIRTMDLQEEQAASARVAIGAIVAKNLAGPSVLLDAFSEFKVLVDTQIPDYVAAWAEGGHSLEETEAEVTRLRQLSVAVEEKSEQLVLFCLIAVDTSSAKASMLDKAEKLRGALLTWQMNVWHKVRGGEGRGGRGAWGEGGGGLRGGAQGTGQKRARRGGGGRGAGRWGEPQGDLGVGVNQGAVIHDT